MAGLFDHFEKYDVQAMRAKVREEVKAEVKTEEHEEAMKKLVKMAKALGANKEQTSWQLVEQYELIEHDTKFQELDEDAYAMIAEYAASSELKRIKKHYQNGKKGLYV